MKTLQLAEISKFTDAVCFEVQEDFGYESLECDLNDVVTLIENNTKSLAEAMRCRVLASKRKYQKHADYVDGENIIEFIAERALEEVSDGYADKYLTDISKEKQKELESLVLNWLNANAEQPTFYYQGEEVGIFKLSADVFNHFGAKWGEQ